jgi:hypothetical protein
MSIADYLSWPPGKQGYRVLSAAVGEVSYERPGTLEGGDVVRNGAPSSTWHLRAHELAPFEYTVRAVNMRGRLHPKSAGTYLGRDTALAQRDWVDLRITEGLRGGRLHEPHLRRRTEGRIIS